MSGQTLFRFGKTGLLDTCYGYEPLLEYIKTITLNGIVKEADEASTLRLRQ